MWTDFVTCAVPLINLLCCPTDPDTGTSDAEQYHTYSELTNPQDPLSKDQWDDVGSSTTPCSQTSDDEAKPGSPTKAEPFPLSKKDDFALPALSLITASASGTEVSKQAAESSQSYAGTHICSWKDGAEGCLGMVASPWGRATQLIDLRGIMLLANGLCCLLSTTVFALCLQCPEVSPHPWGHLWISPRGNWCVGYQCDELLTSTLGARVVDSPMYIRVVAFHEHVGRWSIDRMGDASQRC